MYYYNTQGCKFYLFYYINIFFFLLENYYCNTCFKLLYFLSLPQGKHFFFLVHYNTCPLSCGIKVIASPYIQTIHLILEGHPSNHFITFHTHSHSLTYCSLIIYTILIWFTIIFHAQYDHVRQTKKSITKPRGGPLFNPTSHYYLRTTDYGPLVVNNILQGSSNCYPWIGSWLFSSQEEN